MRLRSLVSRSFGISLLIVLLGAGVAKAAPVWNLDIHHNQTNFPPGGTAEYWFDVVNVGDAGSTGPVTLTVNLPSGITREDVREETDFHGPKVEWDCPGAPEDTSIVCTTTDTVPRHTPSRGMYLSVNVAPGASGTRFATAKVEGGGAAKAATALEATRITAAEPSFGVVEGTWKGDFLEADGLTPVREAGAHPPLASFSFDLNSIAEPANGDPRRKIAVDSLRNLRVDLPPGFIGAPTAVGECTAAQLSTITCPPSSQVGRFDGTIYSFAVNHYITITTGVYNMTHPRGVVTDLGFAPLAAPVHVKASLDPANAYAITTKVPNITESLPVYNNKLTVWGVPADSSHDSERCLGINGGDTDEECSAGVDPRPFLSVPSRCDATQVTSLREYDSWQNPGAFGPDVEYVLPGKGTDCEKPRFEPQVEITPTGKQANTPTGLDVHIKVAQNENPSALSTPPVRTTTVTLPEGMSFSPSFADGLQSCSLAQIKLFSNDPVACPDASRIGEVELSTPLLPEPAEGSMYLAAQGDNPFQSTFALYLVLQDTEERGVLIKIPGRIDVDPASGQITTSFSDTPQFPFDDLTLKFRSGPRAPLVNPPTCGTHTIGVQVSSYAQPASPVDISNTYQVTEGPNGTACPASSGGRPFAPRFSAGTLNPVAGDYSRFLFRISREDHEQELSRVTALLPPGLVAKIAGIPFCPEAAIASISGAEGAGKAELSSSACPAASQIGTLSAGLGAGPGPNYFDGKVYLAGPYKGAPLSLAVVAPGIAGPFDLGNVVVRAALRVDSETARVTAVSDPFPTILQGVLLRVRDVRLQVDRPQTTINPTNCERMAVESEIAGVGGSLLSSGDDSLFDTSYPFQVGECGNLAFAPKLSFQLFGGTSRGAHPKLRAILRMPRGGANIAKASVALPRSEFLDQSHIGTVCTRVQFAADACPAASVYGKVEAKTPLLDETLSGPIYLRSSNNTLPDLVGAFRGGRVDFNLVGRIDSVRGGIRNTFELVPDVPVSSAVFTFLGGRKGLLINSRDLCKRTYRVTAELTAQNGDLRTLRPPLRNSCKSQRKKTSGR